MGERVFPCDRLVGRHPLADTTQAIAASESGAAIKPIVRM